MAGCRIWMVVVGMVGGAPVACLEPQPGYEDPDGGTSESGGGTVAGTQSASADETGDGGSGTASQTGGTSGAATSSATSGEGGDTSTTDPSAGDATVTDSATTGTPEHCRDDLMPPGAGTCPSVCTGGCDMGAGLCMIACTDCQAKTIDCPADWACEITCDGRDSCRDATVRCPQAAYACALTCTGGSACLGLELTCGDGTCSLHCITSNATCRSANMTCGASDSVFSCDHRESEPGLPSVTPKPGSTCACVLDGCLPL